MGVAPTPSRPRRRERGSNRDKIEDRSFSGKTEAEEGSPETGGPFLAGARAEPSVIGLLAKPWAYWWWFNGNGSREGITKDLEEMKRQGINGVLIFHGGGGETPVGPRFLSAEWRELFRHALREAGRLKMNASVNLCDGWCSGGPWITRDLANKKLVYSEIQIDGPAFVGQTLPFPPVLDGYYRDVAVVAFRESSNRPVTPARV